MWNTDSFPPPMQLCEKFSIYNDINFGGIKILIYLDIGKGLKQVLENVLQYFKGFQSLIFN